MTTQSDSRDELPPDAPATPAHGVAGGTGGAGSDAPPGDALPGDAPPGDAAAGPRSGLKAVIDSNVISHERLPMLEVVFDRMVRSLATSMRNLTSDSIDVGLEAVRTERFGDCMNRLALPAMIGVFRVDEWENYGLITVEPALIYAVVDALLGGRRGGHPVVIDGRAFTGIETSLVARMVELALADFAGALEPITPATMTLERIETSPRFAAIAVPTNICTVATFRVDMEGRGGRFSLLLPYGTIEPVRHKLLHRFTGETLGRNRSWEAHMAAELGRAEIGLDVVLGERALPLGQVHALAVGQTIALGRSPDDPLELRCGGVSLGRAQIGQRRSHIAVRLLSDIAPQPER